ncbi:SMI1/KNR4 family protein [Runella limosa]|uniref:SMI1/KNR4 family protein n=1 Tax=Runella limosa TaxID=370978 RepID=UPI00040FEF15|nr:SMI1/KNR4 family protein [Runella limosa]
MNNVLNYFVKLNPPVSEVQIESAEKEMGIKIPSELRTFYTIANGGIPPEGYEYNYNDSFSIGFVSIYDLGFLTSAYLSNKRADEYYKTNDYCSNYLLPFIDLGQNQICIAFNGENIGKIFWLGEPGDGFPVYLLENSLDDFFGKLKHN